MPQQHEINSPPTDGIDDEKYQALERAALFLREQIPVLCKLTGLNVYVEVGRGWATDLETGAFSIDPSFFLEKGYSAEHCVYATLHELLSHVRDVMRDPVHAARQLEFSQIKDEIPPAVRQVFTNILSDIHGNKITHNLLPAMQTVGADIYENRLFSLEHNGKPVDYRTLYPLHLQFLYKMIREEMIPASETPVAPEVDAALERLRRYRDSDLDLITYLTDPASKKDGKDLRSGDRWDYTLTTIWPEYLALYEQAKKDNQTKHAPAQGESQSPGGQGTPTDDPFAAQHTEYFTTKHPEPISPKESEKLVEIIKKAAKKEANKRRPQINPRVAQDKRLRAETGFGTKAHTAYTAEIIKHRATIDEMREVFRSVINEQVALRRGLSRRAHTEGDILDPNRLAQTIIDVQSGVAAPEAYSRYEHIRGRSEMVGKTDYFFVFDCSDSMGYDDGERAKAAATTALIMLEALAGMERDIREAEREHDIELELDIRTALYTFSSGSTCIKPLSSGLSDRERLTTRQSVLSPSGGTADYLALEQIVALENPATDRQRIVIVVSDGEGNDATKASAAISQLRGAGIYVYGIGIGSDAATALYAPEATRVDDANELPAVLQSFIQSTLT